ncbi:hypothetical protein EV359DRAFT_65704 [Lentinula novae-zelandiae]|nr:hypothetical protein EV359DRAFT_65704 [Lentinula novae-zelandiae]
MVLLVSSNMIASSELSKGITQRSYTRGVKSGSANIESHVVMEARSGAIDAARIIAPTKSTAAVHPEPPTAGANVPEQKPKGPKPKTPLVSLFSLTWVGIKMTHLGRGRVSTEDELINHEAVALVQDAAKYKWNLTNHFINHDNLFMYPAAAQPDSIRTTEFKFLLKLKYDHGAEGKNYCEGWVEVLEYHTISTLMYLFFCFLVKNEFKEVISAASFIPPIPSLSVFGANQALTGQQPILQKRLSCEAPAQKACAGLTQTGPKQTQLPPRRYEEVWDSANTGEGSLTRGSCGAWVDLREGPRGVEHNA